DVVPLLFAMITPMGTITAEAFERITNEMVHLLDEHGPWDGVLLAQHGAAVSQDHPDADGEIAARVRHVVGPDTPVGMALDLHANVSRRMVDHTTVTVAYRTNPHVDARQRARECADLVVRTVRGEIRPVQALQTPPVVIDILRQETAQQPMRGLIEQADAVAARPGMLSASVLEGFPYADVAEMGMSVIAISDGDRGAAEAAARHISHQMWDRRAQFTGSATPPLEALKAAADAAAGPVVLMDVGDNIGGGGPADSTVLLEQAVELGIPRYLQTLYDPKAVRTCWAAGAGATVTVRVGAKTDDQHGRPVTLYARVRTLSDGRFEEPEPRHGGFRFFDAGPTAVVETAGGQTVALTSERVANTSLQQLYALGIDPMRMQVIVAKGVNAPRAAYEAIASEIVLVDTPGVTSADLSRFTYHRRRRPLFPFEDPGDAWLTDPT
ncbi:MAG TPA: M81 family metallopeptidase, partial [Euzebyales bacterium]|nr:M81 family metallopeptidase [Euzebyales bacterium]